MADIGSRSTDEVLLAEILPFLRSINYVMWVFRKLMRTSKRFAGWFYKAASARVA